MQVCMKKKWKGTRQIRKQKSRKELGKCVCKKVAREEASVYSKRKEGIREESTQEK